MSKASTKTPKKSKIPYKYEDIEEEPTQEAINGSVSSMEGGELGPLLLELIAIISKVSVLLSETSESEFKAIKPRLDSFVKAVASLPQTAQTTKALGFK